MNLVGDHDLSDKPHTVAYHHKIHFSEERTILNSKYRGQWQEEEIKDDSQLEQGIATCQIIWVHDFELI